MILKTSLLVSLVSLLAVNHCLANNLQQNKICDHLRNLEPAKAIESFVPTLSASLRHIDGSTERQVAAEKLLFFSLACRLDENDLGAAQIARLALRLDPQSISARSFLVETLIRSANYQEALKESTCLLKIANTNWLAARTLGVVALFEGRVKDAKKHLEQALRLNPKDPRSLARLSVCYAALDDPLRSAELRRQAASFCQSPYLRLIFMGMAEEQNKEITKAAAFYKRAGFLLPEDPLWHNSLALVLMQSQDKAAARQEFINALSCPRLSTNAYTHWATYQSFDHKIKQAHKALDHLAKFRDYSAELYLAKGNVYRQQNKIIPAEAAYDMALERNPHLSAAYANIKALPGKTINLDFAKKWSLNCPFSADAQATLGNVFARSNRWGEAVGPYVKALELKAKAKDAGSLCFIASLNAKLSVAYYQLKKSDQALDFAMSFNRLKPNPEQRLGLSIRPPAGMEAKLESSPNPAAYRSFQHAALADCLYESGLLAEAVTEYRKAIDLEKDNIIWHSALLKVLLDKRDFAGAVVEDAIITEHMVKTITKKISGTFLPKK